MNIRLNLYTFLAGLVLSLFLVTPVYADKSYGQPSLSGMPRYPDITSQGGGITQMSGWKMVVAPFSFNYDIYFENGCWKMTFPMYIGRYWQISDICEFNAKPHFRGNNAPAVPQKSWVISYHYDDADLDILGGLSFPENSLKIVHSNDKGETWTMLRSSVVDEENNTVAAITDEPGGYMVMAGFVPPTAFYNYKAVKGAYVERGNELSFGESFLHGFEYLFLLIARAL